MHNVHAVQNYLTAKGNDDRFPSKEEEEPSRKKPKKSKTKGGRRHLLAQCLPACLAPKDAAANHERQRHRSAKKRGPTWPQYGFHSLQKREGGGSEKPLMFAKGQREKRIIPSESSGPRLPERYLFQDKLGIRIKSL